MGGSKSRPSKRRQGSNGSDASNNFDELAQIVASARGTANKKLPDLYRQRKT